MSIASRSRIVRAASAAALAGSFALAGIAAAPGAALAATPECNSFYYFPSTTGNFNVNVPTYKYGNHYYKDCILQEGDYNNNGVRTLQIALSQCNGLGIDVDGDYGFGTWLAVTTAQQDYKITDDGVYGPNTRKAMSWPRAADDPTIKDCGKVS